jgi:D-arabinose 1-dehydrogenase-like Zn-dependent alcohol dehydrogenase
MKDVLKNLQLIGQFVTSWDYSVGSLSRFIGSTMGSRQDLIDATAFLQEHKIIPLVSDVINGLDAAEEGFDILKSGDQFGKVIIRIHPPGPQRAANL